MDAIADLIKLFAPPAQPVQASDGAWFRTAGQALAWDLIERKLRELLPVMQDPGTISKTRRELRLSQADLAEASGLSESLVRQIEAGKRRCTASAAEKIWAAMVREQRAQRFAIPQNIELFFRLESGPDGAQVGVTTLKEKL
jgi:DNA-binding XRE family transcriptional regulator